MLTSLLSVLFCNLKKKIDKKGFVMFYVFSMAFAICLTLKVPITTAADDIHK